MEFFDKRPHLKDSDQKKQEKSFPNYCTPRRHIYQPHAVPKESDLKSKKLRGSAIKWIASRHEFPIPKVTFSRPYFLPTTLRPIFITHTHKRIDQKFQLIKIAVPYFLRKSLRLHASKI